MQIASLHAQLLQAKRLIFDGLENDPKTFFRSEILGDKKFFKKVKKGHHCNISL